MCQAQQLGVELCLGGRHTRLGGEFLRQVLVDLLRAECTRALHRAGSRRIVRSVCRIGAGLSQCRTCQRHIGLHRLWCKCGEQLAAFHLVTHLCHELLHPQAIDFSTDAGLLPGGDAAVGGQRDGQAVCAGLGQRDRQGRFGGGSARLDGIGCVGTAGQEAQRGKGQQGGGQQPQGHRFELESVHGVALG